jgi:hypothetical protein
MSREMDKAVRRMKIEDTEEKFNLDKEKVVQTSHKKGVIDGLNYNKLIAHVNYENNSKHHENDKIKKTKSAYRREKSLREYRGLGEVLSHIQKNANVRYFIHETNVEETGPVKRIG